MKAMTGPLSSLLRLANEGRGLLDGAWRAGLMDPTYAMAGAAAFASWGASPAAAYAAAALRYPTRTAVIDDEGRVSYAELDRRSDAGAVAVADLLSPGATVGLLCRNHRGFVEAHLAICKAGATPVLLNTGFAPPQLADVVAREGISLLLHDGEFTAIVGLATPDLPSIVVDGPAADPASLAARVARHRGERPRRPARVGQPVLLTSGTTGTPKGARRNKPPRDPRAAAGLLAALPYRRGDVVVLPAPLFHAWGFSHHLMAGALAMTLVLSRQFDPEETLAAVSRERATVLAVVPVMLQRILALGPEVIGRYDTHRLRVVASSGSALPGNLSAEWMRTFGDNLYNLYGSTEVGQATMAGPADLRAAPGTAGRPLIGSTVKILGEDGRPVARGAVGRIFVGNANHFDAYTGGGTKDRIGSLLASGDLGFIDDAGRLYVGGRDDDMIISGGENVFPREVEDLLASHPAVADAAVVGVPDDVFGQRLAAWVVLRPGAELSVVDVQNHVRAHLARHKVPRDVTFLDELPRNATGKLLRRQLVAARADAADAAEATDPRGPG
jgi:fatty-acyl-CoA synthase